MLMARAAELEAKGIPTHLDEVAHVGVVPQHLYILLDEQFADAFAVLENSTHEVAAPVYPDQLEAVLPSLEESARLAGHRLVKGLLVVTGVLLLLLLALAVIV